MTNESGNLGDKAEMNLQTSVLSGETVGVEGFYQIECRDAQGNIKWGEDVPNLVVSAGKQLMMDTFLKGASYSVTGPYLGLISNTFTASAADTMSSHPWSEFVNYTVGGSAIRGTAAFASSTSSGATPSNVVASTATPITYTITGAGGTIYGCFLVLGSGAVSTQNSTAGTLYSEGLFSVSKNVTAGDTVTVTYTTTATS
jgi:hypothetical protein